MAKVVCVVGPNGIGKTALAFHLSSLLPASLVNADSRQVYRGLNIVSGKDIPLSAQFVSESIPHFLNKKKFNLGYYVVDGTRIYLTDLVDPSYSFNVYDFVSIAYPLIQSISQRGKLPILVGGTGFYFKALLDGIDTLHIPMDESFREELQRYSVKKLQAILEKEDKEKFISMNQSDRANPRRLIRAVEVARWRIKHNQHVIKVGPLLRSDLSANGYDFLIIGLYASMDVLKARIDKRVNEWLKMGALEEVRRLFQQYDHLSSQVKTSVGYRELFEYCAGKVDLAEAIDNVNVSELQYSKRQMTWFKKEKRIHWFDASKSDFYAQIDIMVLDWYKRGG